MGRPRRRALPRAAGTPPPGAVPPCTVAFVLQPSIRKGCRLPPTLSPPVCSTTSVSSKCSLRLAAAMEMWAFTPAKGLGQGKQKLLECVHGAESRRMHGVLPAACSWGGSRWWTRSPGAAYTAGMVGAGTGPPTSRAALRRRTQHHASASSRTAPTAPPTAPAASGPPWQAWSAGVVRSVQVSCC
jgi:hypothetical protein